MALTNEDVRKIATLAQLRFSPEEEERFTGQLARIVDYIDQLQSFAPDASDPPDGTVPGVREAEDRPRDCLPRERFLANAPAALDGFLLVPEVKGGSGDP
jgi:aspartyl-tRNA(Asn)/glutamyl-tRNA(Gln) amidotransferase subunit C